MNDQVKDKPEKAKSEAQKRQEREAEALRANLKNRKAAARRKEDEKDE